MTIPKHIYCRTLIVSHIHKSCCKNENTDFKKVAYSHWLNLNLPITQRLQLVGFSTNQCILTVEEDRGGWRNPPWCALLFWQWGGFLHPPQLCRWGKPRAGILTNLLLWYMYVALSWPLLLLFYIIIIWPATDAHVRYERYRGWLTLFHIHVKVRTY